jgi:hypothetical protein
MVDILKWVLYSGGFAIIVSWICERSDKFQGLESNVKWIIQFSASVVIAVGAYAALTYVPADVWVQIDPWIKLVLGVASAYGLNQVAHTVDPLRIKNAG